MQFDDISFNLIEFDDISFMLMELTQLFV